MTRLESLKKINMVAYKRAKGVNRKINADMKKATSNQSFITCRSCNNNTAQPTKK